MKYVAMHEFGHQLGFDDNYQPSCAGVTIMAQYSPYNPPDFSWIDYCGFNFYYDPTCEAGGGEDYWSHCTPLVLSFDAGKLHLSEPKVAFDIGATGVLPACAWLQRAVDGFLALDRDGDGVISSGKELFGNSTPLSNGIAGTRAWNGFSALAFFDRIENGGNGNGIIDRDDDVYVRLRVWFDWNRDGVSQPGELISLAALGVHYIQFNGLAIDRLDHNGNRFWFGTTFAFRNGGVTRDGSVTDVILRVIW
jgi:hypothetical protein